MTLEYDDTLHPVEFETVENLLDAAVALNNGLPPCYVCGIPYFVLDEGYFLTIEDIIVATTPSLVGIAQVAVEQTELERLWLGYIDGTVVVCVNCKQSQYIIENSDTCIACFQSVSTPPPPTYLCVNCKGQSLTTPACSLCEAPNVDVITPPPTYLCVNCKGQSLTTPACSLCEAPNVDVITPPPTPTTTHTIVILGGVRYYLENRNFANFMTWKNTPAWLFAQAEAQQCTEGLTGWRVPTLAEFEELTPNPLSNLVVSEEGGQDQTLNANGFMRSDMNTYERGNSYFFTSTFDSSAARWPQCRYRAATSSNKVWQNRTTNNRQSYWVKRIRAVEA